MSRSSYWDRTDIMLTAAPLEVGASMRTECPACGKRTFSLSRTAEGVLYNCYSASCALGSGGFVPTAGQLVSPERQAPAEKPLEPYTGLIENLLPEDVRYFHHEFELSGTRAMEHIQLGADGRYVLPIRDPYQRVKGYTLRTPWAGAPLVTTYSGPKARVYMHSYGPAQAFYFGPGPRKHALLVEDQLSAIKAVESGAVGVAVALLGSGGSVKVGNMGGSDAVREISLVRPLEVIVALDADATERAFKWARKWGLAFPKVRVAILQRDIKDTRLHDIPDALGVTVHD